MLLVTIVHDLKTRKRLPYHTYDDRVPTFFTPKEHPNPLTNKREYSYEQLAHEQIYPRQLLNLLGKID